MGVNKNITYNHTESLSDFNWIVIQRNEFIATSTDS